MKIYLNTINLFCVDLLQICYCGLKKLLKSKNLKQKKAELNAALFNFDIYLFTATNNPSGW